MTTTELLVFFIPICGLFALDMWLHRRNPEQNFKQDLFLCITWIASALLFNLYIAHEHGTKDGLLFLTGYLVELSLSVDNLFVIMMIFSYFRVPKKHQHRVLFWGITGAFILRALFIFGGVAIVEKFHWMMYVFGAFLIFTGLKTLKEDKSESSISENKITFWCEHS